MASHLMLLGTCETSIPYAAKPKSNREPAVGAASGSILRLAKARAMHEIVYKARYSG